MGNGVRLRELVKTTEIEVDGRRYLLRFFESKTARGHRRFSCDVMLDPTDRIILDDDSLAGLETRVLRIAPALTLSRALAGRPDVAA